MDATQSFRSGEVDEQITVLQETVFDLASTYNNLGRLGRSVVCRPGQQTSQEVDRILITRGISSV